jgi:hypothetical protein
MRAHLIVAAAGMCVLFQGCTEAAPDPTSTSNSLAPGVAAAATAPIVRVFGASGAARVVTAVAEMKDLMEGAGTDNLSAIGPLPNGRRNVNWDGVPAIRTNTDDFPSDFFNATVTRGLISNTPGIGFRVSDNDFGDVNPSYGAQFDAFSPLRTFAPVGSNFTDVTFRVPGTTTPATTNGFGALFSDVDKTLSTRMMFYDASDKLLAVAFVPRRSGASSQSVAGIVFGSPVVARVRIMTGEAALGAAVNDVSNGGASDLSVMDDFLYGEPQPIETPL